jgi:hypothetical protein
MSKDHRTLVWGLLKYLVVTDIDKVYNHMHYWNFIVGLAEYLESKGKLTDKQIASVTDSILRHTGVTCLISNRLTHEVKYNKVGGGSQGGKKVLHNYDSLVTIQLYDLPFDNGEEVTIELLPYNSHNVVFIHNSKPYKIPLPTQLGKVKEAVTITAKYRRTKMKGFLDDIQIR